MAACMVPACALQLHGATLGCISQWAASLHVILLLPMLACIMSQHKADDNNFQLLLCLGFAAFTPESSLLQVEHFTVGLFQNQCSTEC